MPADSYLYCVDLPTRPSRPIGRILVTGASGYIGGRLVPELLGRNYKIRVMVRAASAEHAERWPSAEIVAADALDLDSVRKTLEGVDTVYYLIHSLLLGPKEFESADIRAAANFRIAAEEQGVRRIIYLGGLGDTTTDLSPHLRSRLLVAQELRKGRVPVTILRAAVIIGSGSASYEIINTLVRSLPVIPTPSWAATRCQPIGVRDVVKYLVGALETEESAGRSFDIGGRDILTYEEMMKVLAGILGRKIFFFRSPVSSIRLYSYLASMITPVPHPITRCLMESITHEVICKNDDIRRVIPFETLSYKEALVRAMSRVDQDQIYTRWSDAYPPANELAIKLNELKPPPQFTTTYSLLSAKSPAAIYNSACSIGGKEGWFHGNWMWRLRGWLDRLLLGVGTSRGRRCQWSLRINDVIDFWRVERLQINRLILLRAEMKLPGKAWLQFRIEEEGDKTRLWVEAFYFTTSLAGKAYWYACLPFHLFIFQNLIKQIEKRSRED